jgi:hypothetical protein
MNRAISFLTTFLIIFLLILQSSFSEDNIKIKLKSFEPGFTQTVLQGGSNRTLFIIKNTFNESVLIYYKFEQQPSDVSIAYYPNKFYNLEKNSEIAGNLNFSANQTAKNGTYSIKFWIETLSEIENKTIMSDKYTINLTVLNNPLLVNITTTLTIPNQTTTSLIGTTTKQTTTTIQSTQPEKKIIRSFKKEYLIIPIILILLFILPPIMLREKKPKNNVSI